nr:Hsp70 family protein [uncultured Acidocella sp.]
MSRIFGIDFGTTNSVVAELGADGQVTSRVFTQDGVSFETFRTVLCFWQEESKGRPALRHAAGPAAVETYLEDPLEARLIMSMKTYLAQKSFTQTQIFGRSFTLEEMIALFLKALLGDDREARIVAGRPVRFAGEFADDAFGEARLRAAFAAAGLPEIETAYEPEAAGYRFIRALQRPAHVLVGDFGGGTSDFSILRFTPGAEVPIVTLANTGVGIAGDSLDYRIIDNAISPLLGKGDEYRVPMGKDMPIPIEYFTSFANWHKLSLMRSPRVLRDIEEVAKLAHKPQKLRNLLSLIKDESGYHLYQAVSRAKAELSRQEGTRLRFEHEDFTLDREIARAEFEGWIAPELGKLDACIQAVLDQAGMQASGIDRVFLTGGTSFVPAVRGLFERRFGAESLSAGGEFVSVAEGLALIGRDKGL